MQFELKRIQREVGISFVYVTHDQGEALTMSDRIAVMNGGRVEHLGAPEEVYQRPDACSSPASSGRPTCCPATWRPVGRVGPGVRLPDGSLIRAVPAAEGCARRRRRC